MNKVRIIVICILLNGLIGCTAIGLFIDESVANLSQKTANNGVFIKDEEGFSFTKMGYEVDSTLVSFIKNEVVPKPKIKCKQITKYLKECVELDKTILHEKDAMQLKTDDEIIDVVQ